MFCLEDNIISFSI